MKPPEDCSPELSLAVPEGWSFSLRLTQGPDGAHGGVAELHEGDSLRCRMQLSNLDRDRAAALERVAERVRSWLAEWATRDHSGSTGFADL